MTRPPIRDRTGRRKGGSANAEAARRVLSPETPDLGEVRQALDDIVRDDARATDVIDRIRSLVRKRPFRPERLRIHSVTEEVVGLLQAEATRLGVTIDTDVGSDLPEVVGDLLQLQQVLLNVMLNAIEAMADEPPRWLLLRAIVVNSDSVQVMARDSGPGANVDNLDELFESFYTTKSEGMGMGLAIARSIVEAHEGRIWATKNDDRGLTFHFTVPIAS